MGCCLIVVRLVLLSCQIMVNPVLLITINLVLLSNHGPSCVVT